MGRIRPTGMYRNAFKHERSLEYERAYRSSVAEFERELKPRRGRYRRQTKWWQGYAKALPGKYEPAHK